MQEQNNSLIIQLNASLADEVASVEERQLLRVPKQLASRTKA